MIHKLVCLCLVATSFAIASVTADEVASHKERMDTAEDLKADLKDALDAGSAAKAGQSADELTKVLEQEEQYWIKTKLDDAIKLAQINMADSKQIATDAKAGKIDDAKTVYKQLQKTCTECHGLHPDQRVKPE
jgi:membrane carboxypeptidase/penicillin-binding protein